MTDVHPFFLEPVMVETVETGFENLPTEPTPPKMTDAERRAAEIAEGARMSQVHAGEPVVPHPSQLYEQQQREALEKLAVESEAARLNRELFERIKAARNQPPPPPAPTQPVTPLMAERTRLEIEAGRKACARHVEQQRSAVRRQPSAAEVAAQGKTESVYNPDTVIRKEAFPAQPRLPGETSTSDAQRGYRTV